MFLFTASFPFGVDEKTFIVPELSYLVELFDITVVSSAMESEILDTGHTTMLDARVQLCAISRPTGTWQKMLAALKSSWSVIKSNLFWEELSMAKHEGKLSLACLREVFSFYVRAVVFYKKFSERFSKQDTKNAIFYTFWCMPQTFALTVHREDFLPSMIFTRMHGGDLYHERTACERQAFRNYLNNNIDGIFFVAHEAMRYYEMNFPECRKEILHVCPLGVVRRALSPINESAPFELVSCAHVIPLKRLDIIVRALAEVPDNMLINWTHFGFGDQYEEIKNLAEKLLGNKKNITFEFKGMVPNEKVISYYENHAVSCFITTSETEGLPVSIQEALACGLPVIGTDVGGIKSTISGNGVLLSSSPSIIEVVNAIKKIYYLSKDEKVEYQKRSFELWQNNFDTTQNTKHLCEVIKNIGM